MTLDISKGYRAVFVHPDGMAVAIPGSYRPVFVEDVPNGEGAQISKSYRPVFLSTAPARRQRCWVTFIG